MSESMKEWLGTWRAVRDYINETFDGLAHRTDDLTGRVAAIEKRQQENEGKWVVIDMNNLIKPKPEPQGVYVREGMQVETKEGNIFTVRKNHPVAGYEDCIDVWLSNGSHGVIRKGEITYGGRPVLGYVEDRP